MEQLLATYLYQHKICPLPGVGSLLLQEGQATALQADKKILAPAPSILLSGEETESEGLLQYLSELTGNTRQQCADALQFFCNKILSLEAGNQLDFAQAGVFKNEEGEQPVFETAALQACFLPELPAERVVHPDATHSMLVGDTQTDTGTMTELLFTEEKQKRSLWIWWAAGIALLAALAIALHYSNGSGWGNQQSISVGGEPAATYTTGSK